MGRRPGSNNKIETQIKKLEKAGYKVVKNTIEKVGQVTAPLKKAGVLKVEVTPRPVIKKAGETVTPAKEGAKETWKCGVSICGYSSDAPFEKCPKCGTLNKW